MKNRDRGISPMDTARHPERRVSERRVSESERRSFSERRVSERRAFLRVLTATTAALAMGGCGVGGPESESSPTAANLAPAWQTVPNIMFAQGVAASVSIASYVSDASGYALAITMNSAALPAGVTYDAANKRFVYDGVGPVGSASGVVLIADDGQPAS
jgi:hypothetical protein